MAQTNVDVVVRVKDLAALERLKKSLAGVEGATFKGSRGIKQFENSLNRLKSVLGGLAVGDQLRRAFGAAADFSATQQRLANLTKQYEQFAGIQDLATISAQKFGVSNAQAASDLADLGSRLGSTGANLKDLSDIYEGFNTILAVNAVDAQQAASAQLQLNQALGSGRLAGEEFNAINEAAPQLLDQVARELNVTRGELKQLASDGAITSDVLIRSLKRAADEGGDALADFFKTPAGQLKLFDKAIKDFQVTIGQQLLPVLTPLVEIAADLLQLFGQLPGPVKATAVAVTALGAAFALLGGPVTIVSAALIGLALLVKKFAEENEQFANALQGAWNTTLAALAGVGAFIQSVFNDFTAYVSGFIDYFIGAWNNAINVISQTIGVWQKFFNAVVQALATTWNNLMQLIPSAFYKAIEVLGAIFKPFIDFFNSGLSAISNAWGSLLEGMVQNWGSALTEMIGMFLPFVKIFKAIGLDIGESISNGISAGFKAFQNFKPGEMPSLNLPGVSGITVPTPTGGSGGGGRGGRGGAGEAERLLELQSQQLQNAQDLLFASENQLRALEGITEAERLRAESGVKKLEIERKYEKLLADSLSAEETLTLQLAQKNEIKATEIELEQSLADLREGALSSINDEISLLQAKLAGKEEEYLLQKKINDLVAAGGGTVSQAEATAAVERLQLLKEQVAEMEKTKQMVSEISGTIASEFTRAIGSVIDGTKSVDQAFSDMLKNIGQSFIDMAMKIIEQQIQMIIYGLIMKALGVGTSGGGSVNMPGMPSGTLPGTNFFEARTPGLASGGPVQPNKPIIVGERGPELFLPNQAGYIQSNTATRASLPQNTQPRTIRFETTMINNVEYVTKEEAIAIGRQAADDGARRGAKMGVSQTMSGLQNSRSQRAKLGMR